MADELDDRLNQLVYENWALIHDLYERAGEFRRMTLDAIENAVRAQQILTQPKFAPADIAVSRKGWGWYIALSAPNFPVGYLSFVQVEFQSASSELEVVVMTGYYSGPGLTGLSGQDIRAGAAAWLDAHAGARELVSGRTVVLRRRVVPRPDGLASLETDVVDEVEYQLDLAAILRETIVRLKPNPAS